MKNYDLERFLREQEYDYDTALEEIRAGQKQSHWIWYIFPQMRGLGSSHYSEFFGIEDIGEARAYLQHPVLGGRLREITEALLGLEESDPEKVMGSSIDSVKLNSCMTLFAAISEEGSIFHKVLDKFFGGQKDSKTLSMLQQE